MKQAFFDRLKRRHPFGCLLFSLSKNLANGEVFWYNGSNSKREDKRCGIWKRGVRIIDVK